MALEPSTQTGLNGKMGTRRLRSTGELLEVAAPEDGHASSPIHRRRASRHHELAKAHHERTRAEHCTGAIRCRSVPQQPGHPLHDLWA